MPNGNSQDEGLWLLVHVFQHFFRLDWRVWNWQQYQSWIWPDKRRSFWVFCLNILFQRWKHWREIRIVLIPTSIYSNSETPPKSATDVSVALRCIFSHVHRNDPDPTFSQSSFLYQTKTAKKALYLKLTSRLVAVDENEGKAHDYKVLEHQASFLLSGWDRCVVSAVKRFVGCFFVYELTLKTFKYQQAAI